MCRRGEEEGWDNGKRRAGLGDIDFEVRYFHHPRLGTSTIRDAQEAYGL